MSPADPPAASSPASGPALDAAPPAARPGAARFLPDGLLAGELAVVTGGGTGLGLALSRGLCALGARVVVLSRDPEHHAPLCSEARERGWSVASLAADVREGAAVRAAAARVAAEHGPVSLLVNNAAGNFVCPFERMSENAWRAVVGIALDGTFHVTRAFGPAMIEARRGAILNVVATYAWTGAAGVAHSASAKAGVLALTKSLALEWAPYGIRVNAIAPGPFHSEGAAENLWPDPAVEERIRGEVPLGRFGATDEIAGHMLWLLSPASGWITGECLVVDGGLSLGRSFWRPGERVRRRPRPDEGTDAESERP